MRLITICLLVALCAAVAIASPFQFTFTGQGSGSLNGAEFTGASLVITGAYETMNIARRSPTVLAVLVDSTSVAIGGMDTVTVTGPIYLFVNSSTRRVGINNGAIGLYQASSLDFFGAWYLDTAIGPVDTSSASIETGASSISTTGGALGFHGWAASGTFAANADVPEPAAVVLAGLGLVAAALSRRRRI